MLAKLMDATKPETRPSEWVSSARRVCAARAQTAILRGIAAIASRDQDEAVSTRQGHKWHDLTRDLERLDRDVAVVLDVARFVENEVGAYCAAAFAARVVYGMNGRESALALGISENVERVLYGNAVHVLRDGGLARAVRNARRKRGRERPQDAR